MLHNAGKPPTRTMIKILEALEIINCYAFMWFGDLIRWYAAAELKVKGILEFRPG
jgi:hypothetical protein